MPCSDTNLYHDVIRMICEGYHMSERRVSLAEMSSKNLKTRRTARATRRNAITGEVKGIMWQILNRIRGNQSSVESCLEKCNEPSSYITCRNTLYRMSNQKPPKKGSYTSRLQHGTVVTR